MHHFIHAACACHNGKRRSKNQDNFYFCGQLLPVDHQGLTQPLQWHGRTSSDFCMAVFDGMGGELFGERASHAAASLMQLEKPSFLDFFASPERRLTELVDRMDAAVVQQQRQLHTERMGTTMVSLHFIGRHGYLCNVGDSRAYMLRENSLKQLSKDHTFSLASAAEKKPPLIQYLGAGSDEVQLEPHIVRVDFCTGDKFLLCSDGLTDMVSDESICAVLQQNQPVDEIVRSLIDTALECGGRDNITVIVCSIE